MTEWLRQSTSVTVMLGPFLDATTANTDQTTLTITQPDIRISKNGGAWAQKAAAQTLTHAEAGWYGVTLDATDTNTLGRLKVAIHESPALNVWESFMVVTANVWDSLFGSALQDVNVVNAAGTAWNSGAIGAATLAADTLTAAKVAADVSTEFATTFFGTAIPGAFGAGTAGSRLGKLPDVTSGAAGGVFIAGTNAATTITTGLTTTFTGNLTGSVGSVTGSVGSVTGAVGSVTGAVASVTGAVGSVTGNVGGNVTGSVGSVAAGGITNASFAADAISASKVNADVGAEYASAFFSTAIPGAFGAGTAGSRLGKLPDVTAGAAGGVFIAGTNAATTITTGLTTTFTGNLTGSVASVTGAVGSVTGSVASVTGSVGSVTGAVGSVTGLTASNLDATVSSRLSTVGYTVPPSAASNAIAVWTETLPGSYTSGQAGYKLNAAGAAGDPWSTLIPGAYGVGTAGSRLGKLPDVTAGGSGGVFIAGTNAATAVTTSFTSTFTGDLTGSVASVTGSVGSVTGAVGSVTGAVGSVTGNVGGNVTGSVGTVNALAANSLTAAAAAADLTTELQAGLATATNVSAVQTAVLAKLPAALVSGRIDASVGAVATDAIDANALAASAVDEILDEIIEGTYTLRQLLRLTASALASKVSGADTTTITFRDISDTKNRIVATVDANGNRSSLTLDVT